MAMGKGLLLGSAIGDCELDVKPLKSGVRSRSVQDVRKGFWLINQMEYSGANDVATLMMVCQGVARPLSAPNTS